ncbi:MAG TPA: hypothetical protein VK961_04270, partial [Chthoniobacter sp.]|nr:hypothetical protein [Chthoniobacter sp.]
MSRDPREVKEATGTRGGEETATRREDDASREGIPASPPPRVSAPLPAAPTFIERIIDASARNKFLIFIFTVFAVAGGIYALLRTPLDAIP